MARSKAGFRAAASVMHGLHYDASQFADESNNHERFQHAWMLFEVLVILWRTNVDVAGNVSWVLDMRHHLNDLEQQFRQVESIIEEHIQTEQFFNHACSKCAVPAVTVDAKYGFTCPVCNYRDGGAKEFPNIDATVLFGCNSPPAPGSTYCAELTVHLASPDEDKEEPRVLRHRTHCGQREYKIDNSSAWHLRDGVPQNAHQVYEINLSERADRRKRRRHKFMTGSIRCNEGPDVEVDSGEVTFHDTLTEALKHSLWRKTHVE